MKYVCYIFETPVLEAYEEWFTFNAFRSQGYGICIIDISPVVNKTSYESTKAGLMDYRKNNIFRCFTYAEIKEKIIRLPPDTVVFTIFAWKPQTVRIIKDLTRCRLKYGMMVLNGSYEFANPKYCIKERIKIFLSTISMSSIIQHIFVRIPKRLLGISCASYFIYNAGDENIFRKTFYCDANTRFLKVHSMMYEQAIRNAQAPRIVTERYCVYLDTYDPYHPDLKSADFSLSINADEYYSALRGFLQWVEQAYGIKVIVAAHPRSEYEKHPEALEGFDIIKFKTDLLVKNCEFAITICSTSFLFAVLYHKPLLIIRMDAINNSYYHAMQRSFANYLEKKVISIDEINDELKEKLEEEFAINDHKYEEIFKCDLDSNYNGSIDGVSYYGEIVNFVEACRSWKQ